MTRASTTLLVAICATGCAEPRHVRVVFEAAPGTVLVVGSLLVTARLEPEGEAESVTVPEDGGGVTLPADLVVLLGDDQGTLKVSAIAQAPDGGPVASGSNQVPIEPGGAGRVATLTVTLAPGTDAGCGDGTVIRGEICYRPSWVRVDGRVGGAAVLDADGDGVADLVAGVAFDRDGGPRGLSLQHGRGGDRFDTPTRLAGPDLGAWEEAEVVTGDLDGDGRLEVVVGGSYDRPALLSRGTASGLGALSSLDEATRGENPRMVDLDGDGDLDVVTHAGHFVYTFLGDGQGALAPGPDFSFEAETYALDAREIDDRPGAEVVVSSIELQGRPQHVTVLGLEGGRLVARGGLEDVPSPSDIAVAELDGTAPAEIVTIGEGEPLRVLAGVDDALSVDAEMQVDASHDSDALRFLDSVTTVRRAGQPDDVAVALSGESWDPRDVVTIVLLRPLPGARTLAEHARTNLHCSRGLLHAGDVDGDGDEEILVSCNEASGYESSGVVVLRVGDDGLDAPARGAAGGAWVDVGDMDADGVADLVQTDGSDLSVRIAADTATGEVVLVGRAGADLLYPVAADLDGDGQDEIAALCRYCSAEEGSILRWRRGSLGWTSESADIEGRTSDDPTPHQPMALVAARLVPGEPPRLVTAAHGGTVYVWGDAGLEEAAGVLADAGSEEVRLAAGEIDGVPGDDVVGTWTEAEAVALFRGDGAGGLADGELVAERVGDGGPGPLAVGDADGDGRAEIFVGRRYSRDVLVLGLRDGAVQEIASFQTGVAVHSASVVDLDGDGAAELVLAGEPMIGVFSIGADGPIARLALPGSRGFQDRLHPWPRPGAGDFVPPTLWTAARTEVGSTDFLYYALSWAPVP